MTPFFLLRSMTSMKKEVGIVLLVIVTLLVLPIATLGSLTNFSALGDSSLKLFAGTGTTDNTYAYGNCTFWVFMRREEIGRLIPNTLGNANTWDSNAKLGGYLVDHTPTVGAIMQTDAGALGHVAFVEKVELDGSWIVSEMNVKGWDIVSSRTFKADLAITYNFMH